MAERNRDQMIQKIQNDPRLGDGVVETATALMRVSIFMLMGSGVIGLIVAQVILGEGMAQFLLGMAVGYGGYFLYSMRTMGEPRVIGVMAVLTDKGLVLLGSRKAGVVGEWTHAEIEKLELIRKGNLFIMGKVSLTPVGKEPINFFMSNRRLGMEFVESFQELHSSDR
ncbi:MAG: hypothetical protein GY788_21565 [bacterium]|nr:hypothetical protein [bacterium]